MSESQTGAGNQEFQSLNVIENLKTLKMILMTFWTTFVFMSICSKVTVYWPKCQCFFGDLIALSCEFRVHRAGSQLKWFIKILT